MNVNVIEAINNPDFARDERIDALRSYAAGLAPEGGSGEVNNHIHTVYSFSPYTPAMAALKAREAGLQAAGSVDHDSAAAAGELKAACAELGMGGCSGFEIRVSFKKRADGSAGPFAERKINNPDSAGLAYIAVQGIPAGALPKAAAFLKPLREARFARGRAMCEQANELLRDAGLPLIDFENDLVQQSQYKKGGTITERHLMAAAAAKLVETYGKGPNVCAGMKRSLGIRADAKFEKMLSDPENPHYLYDLLGILKTDFLPRIFIQPGESECIPVKNAVDFALSIGAIPAYAYLGDVGESPTGDKKAEKFEDEYLAELFDELAAVGFRAVTYMPPRNSPEQRRRIRRFCREGGYMEISGVDINSSRQSFNCPEVLEKECRHLLDTTWALIAHEYLSDSDPSWGLFSSSNPLASMPLSRRLAVYADAGKSLDRRYPERSAPEILKMLHKGRFS